MVTSSRSGASHNTFVYYDVLNLNAASGHCHVRTVIADISGHGLILEIVGMMLSLDASSGDRWRWFLLALLPILFLKIMF